MGLVEGAAAPPPRRRRVIAAAGSTGSLLRFYLPPEARWAAINGREACEWPLDDNGQNTKPKDIGEHLTKAVRAVVKQNTTLSGVIDIVDFAAERMRCGRSRSRGLR